MIQNTQDQTYFTQFVLYMDQFAQNVLYYIQQGVALCCIELFTKAMV